MNSQSKPGNRDLVFSFSSTLRKVKKVVAKNSNTIHLAEQREVGHISQPEVPSGLYASGDKEEQTYVLLW